MSCASVHQWCFSNIWIKYNDSWGHLLMSSHQCLSNLIKPHPNRFFCISKFDRFELMVLVDWWFYVLTFGTAVFEVHNSRGLSCSTNKFNWHCRRNELTTTPLSSYFNLLFFNSKRCTELHDITVFQLSPSHFQPVKKAWEKKTHKYNNLYKTQKLIILKQKTCYYIPSHKRLTRK